MRPSIRFLLLIITGWGFISGSVQAGERENIAMLELLLNGKPADASQFSAQFLESVPIEKLNSGLSELYQSIGPPIMIVPDGDEYEVITETHVMQALISLEEAGIVQGLFFRSPVALKSQLSDVLTPLTEHSGDISYLIIKDGSVLAQKDAEVSLAIGSTFKLAILRVLQDQIEAGERQWHDVASIAPELVSLPSGILQDFPINSPLTLHTLASLMISQSDNTATDILLHLVGRDKVSAHLGGQFVLSTREFFQLKDNSELADKFANSNYQTKMEISDELASRPLPSLAAASGIHKLGVEWYLSANELCELLGSVKGLDVFSINPGPSNPNNWENVAYKGGSEVGVFNLTSWLEAEDGHQYCVVYTINNRSGVSERRVISVYASLVSFLAQQN